MEIWCHVIDIPLGQADFHLQWSEFNKEREQGFLFVNIHFRIFTQEFRIRMSNLCALKIPCSYLICPHIHDAVNYDCNCQQRKLTHNIG